MSAPQFAGAFLVVFAVGLFIPGIVQRRRARRRLRASLLVHLHADLTRVTGQRDRYHTLWNEAVATNAVLLEVMDPAQVRVALDQRAETPAFFETTAARWTAADDDAVRRAGGAS